MNKPVSGSNYRRTGAFTEELKVSAQSDPNMTVAINEGSFYTEGMTIVEYEGGTSPVIKAPAMNNEWVIICLNKQGTLSVVEGKPSSKPDVPDVPKDYLPLAAIYLKSTSAKITSDMIFDIRPFMASGSYPGDHSLLENTDLPNCHPISAITNLKETLADKATYADLDKLDLKLDNIKGTNTATFVLNQAQTGEPTANVGISVNRGDENSVGLRYNEKKGVWEFTNDGSVWNEFVSSVNLDGSLKDATASAKGVVKLSAEPADAFNPVAVGDNDPRISAIALKANADDVYSKADIDDLLKNKIDNQFTYSRKSIDEMLAGKMDINVLYTEAQIDAKLMGKANVGDAYTKAETDVAMVKKANVADVYSKVDADALLNKKADVTSVYDKTSADTLLADKADKATTYTKSETDGLLLTKADVSTVYTQSEVDNALALKANLANTYSKVDVDGFLSLKADVSNVYDKASADAKFAPVLTTYTKDDVDTALANKADVTDVYKKVDADALYALKANVADVYTKDDVDIKLTNKADLSKVYTKVEIASQLLPYAKSDDVTATLNNYAKADNVYTKTSVDTLLSAKADTTAVNTALNDKADKDQYYSSAVIDSKLNNFVTKADFNVLQTTAVKVADVYTKDDIDAKLADKGNKVELINLLSTKADDSDLDAYVTKTDLDAKLAKYAKSTLIDSKANVADVYDRDYIDTNVALNSSVDTKLASYAKTEDVVSKATLTNTLVDYAKATDVSALQSAQSSFATKTELANYAKKTDNATSVVLTSANGTKYRLVVADDGTLSTSKVE